MTPPLLPAFVGTPTVNRVYNVDALTLLAALPDGSVDLVVTSPPYNMRTSLNGARPASASSDWGKSQLLAGGYATYSDDLPHETYVRWQRQILSECLRVLTDKGAMFYNHKWRIQGGLLDMRSEIVAGFPVRQIIIWNQGGGVNHKPSFFSPQYEVIYLIAKPKFQITQKATGYGDVWNIPRESNNQHPAPFPELLVERCLLSTTAQVILDPFSGSGTTATVAKRLGRTYIGSDISFEYCEIARRRIDQPFTPPMFANEGAA